MHLLRFDHSDPGFYNNVCLVLDDDTANQICTDTDYGFSDQKIPWYGDQKILVWKKQQTAEKVYLYFRSGSPAFIADLKIYYKKSKTPLQHGNALRNRKYLKNYVFSEAKKISIHGRTHLTAIEFSNNIFGSTDEVCSTCIIDMNFGENVERIRYRSGKTYINVRSLEFRL